MVGRLTRCVYPPPLPSTVSPCIFHPQSPQSSSLRNRCRTHSLSSLPSLFFLTRKRHYSLNLIMISCPVLYPLLFPSGSRICDIATREQIGTVICLRCDPFLLGFRSCVFLSFCFRRKQHTLNKGVLDTFPCPPTLWKVRVSFIFQDDTANRHRFIVQNSKRSITV